MVFLRLVLPRGRVRSGFGCTANTRGAQLSLKCSSTRLPTNYPPRLAPALRCPHWLERRHLNWDWPYNVRSAQRRETVSASTKKFTALRIWAPSYKTRGTVGPLIQSVRMPQRTFFRWVLPAVLGLLAGFLALAWAVPNESAAPVWVVSLVSPGLKVAELVMPSTHESFASTFGWFLRIAIGGNAIFYFAIFALLSYLVYSRRSRSS